MTEIQSTDVRIAGNRRESGLDTRIVWRTSVAVIVLYLVLLGIRAIMINPDRIELIERVAAYLQLGSFIFPTLVAFFGLYLARADMRDGVAGAFVVAFFLILVESVVLNIGTFTNPEDSIRSVALENFMTLVGTIVVFFFGSEAAIRIGGQYAEAKGKAAEVQADATVKAAQVSSNQVPD